MEEQAQTILAVAQNLESLFAEKSSLNGFADWDNLIGCVMALRNVAGELQTQQKAGE